MKTQTNYEEPASNAAPTQSVPDNVFPYPQQSPPVMEHVVALAIPESLYGFLRDLLSRVELRGYETRRFMAIVDALNKGVSSSPKK